MHDPYRVEPRKPLTPKQRAKYVRGSVADRLWAKVRRGPDDECWPFMGATTARGYGKISSGGKNAKTLLAHRVAFAVSHGRLADNECVLHTCDNPNCCNPGHLTRGTLSDNTQDMIAKGRHFTPWRGGSAHHAKLTEQDVVEIRASLLGYRRLAKLYGVNRCTIGAIKRGETWRHVT